MKFEIERKDFKEQVGQYKSEELNAFFDECMTFVIAQINEHYSDEEKELYHEPTIFEIDQLREQMPEVPTESDLKAFLELYNDITPDPLDYRVCHGDGVTKK